MGKVSVIMPSYLSNYEGGATNRVEKFTRAVNSFLSQTHQEKELIIVSDGCLITNGIYKKNYFSFDNIKLVELNKQPLFSGNVREAGLRVATGDIIGYLDTDDEFGINHIKSIDDGFNNNADCDWVYFNDCVVFLPHLPHIEPATREVKLEYGTAGTSCIAHKNIDAISWVESDGYGHDWMFIQKLINCFPDYKKIDGTDYRVCHIKGSVDC